MYFEGKAVMKACTKKQKQWLWFITLWLGGFSSVLLLSTIIKLAMRII